MFNKKINRIKGKSKKEEKVEEEEE